MENAGCSDLSQLNTGIVSQALLTFSNKDAYARIRQFLNYLAEKGIIEVDFSRIVPHYKRDTVLPTTYTPDEISRVEVSVDTNTTIGKRNLAIIRLASRMGLRAGDIAKLKLSEINFSTGYISITQEKTGIPLTLQILPLIHYGLIAAGIWLDCLDFLHIPAKLLLNHFSDFSGISTKGII